jgi:nanoRNase/pAp phosphatase (c-di-AMP/oligoRNAs hydrolase)
LHGIQSDTDGLTRGCCDAEFEASAFLRRAADPGLLGQVTNPPIDAETLDVRARAIANRRVEGPFLVSDVGQVSNTDAIASAAEEVLRLEGITVAVVYGEHEGTLHVSGRSADDSVHVGDALTLAVEDIPMAEAGGHARMGGGQLSVDHMRGLGPGDGITHAEFEHLVLAALAGERQGSSPLPPGAPGGTDRIRSR